MITTYYHYMYNKISGEITGVVSTSMPEILFDIPVGKDDLIFTANKELQPRPTHIINDTPTYLAK